MKKCIIFMVFLILFANPSLVAGLENDLNLYYFYSEGCAPCSAAEDAIFAATTNYPTINIISIPLDSEETVKTYNDFRIAFNVIDDGYVTPFIAIGNDSYVGYTNDLENKLTDSIKANLNTDEECLADIAYSTPEILTSEWFADTYLSDVSVREDNDLDIYVFYTQHCAPCVELINEIQSQEWSGTSFYLYEMADPLTVDGIYFNRMNMAFMNAFIQEKKGYPQIYIGDDEYQGYYDGYISDLVNQYQQNGTGSSGLADKVYNRYNDEIWTYATIYGKTSEKDEFTEVRSSEELIVEEEGIMPYEDTSVENKAYNAIANRNAGVYMFWGTVILLSLYLVYSRHVKK